MITREFASHIVEEWIALWNSHDLEHSLSHYTDLVQMSSPSIARIARGPSGVLKGKSAFTACWANALELMPLTHFELDSMLIGAESLAIYYKGASGMATEIFSSLQTGRLQNLPSATSDYSRRVIRS